MNANRFLQVLMWSLAFLAVTALTACAVAVDPQSATPSALIDRLPSGATAIGWIDVERIAESLTPEQWAEYLTMAEEDENWQDLERFAEATGFDPRTDLRQLAVVILPGVEDDVEPVCLIAAQFDRAQLESFLAEAETFSYEGHTIYKLDKRTFERFADMTPEEEAEEEAGEPAEGEAAGESEEDSPAFLAILDDSTVALGGESGVKLAIDVALRFFVIRVRLRDARPDTGLSSLARFDLAPQPVEAAPEKGRSCSITGAGTRSTRAYQFHQQGFDQ